MESTAQQAGISGRSGTWRGRPGRAPVAMLLSVGMLAGAAQARSDLFEPIDAAHGYVRAFDEEIGGTDQQGTRDTLDPFSFSANADDQAMASSWRLGDAIGRRRSLQDGYVGIASIEQVPGHRGCRCRDPVELNADGNDFGNEELWFWQIERGTGTEFPLLYENSGAGSVMFSLTADDIWDYRIFGYNVASGGSGQGFVWM
ncbi:MAG: hypothetical protein IPJ41_13450, partial [Phycisphaerales bacterium]|nr:hypothetical protein [Phycisphaerales bacterium]